jgi:hypothetical protein
MGRNAEQDKLMAEASEPVSDHLTNNSLSIAEVAAAILAKDKTEVQLAVKQLGDSGLRDLIDELGYLEQRLLSLAEFARAQAQAPPRAVAALSSPPPH